MDLPNLRTLDLSTNYIFRLDGNAFRTLNNLRVLDLSNNLIAELDMDVFVEMDNLRHLTLSSNPVSHIFKGGSEAKHPNLQSLEISRAPLELFSGDSLSSFSGLTRLNLSLNAIVAINETGFTATPGLVTLDLRGNPLKVCLCVYTAVCLVVNVVRTP
ncbi:phospholipase A2 inhibitor beta-like [Littorina saxatilis]|uniref:phospholipase A2 inhibitor beta-like n=1 Tax=Littorina saxatilis TaxID=31220 RepID=UPI0038B64C17